MSTSPYYKDTGEKILQASRFSFYFRAKIFEKFTAIEKDIIEVRQFIDNEF